MMKVFCFFFSSSSSSYGIDSKSTGRALRVFTRIAWKGREGMEIKLFGGGRGGGVAVREEENGSLTGFLVLRGGGFTHLWAKCPGKGLGPFPRKELWSHQDQILITPLLSAWYCGPKLEFRSGEVGVGGGGWRGGTDAPKRLFMKGVGLCLCLCLSVCLSPRSKYNASTINYWLLFSSFLYTSPKRTVNGKRWTASGQTDH